MTKKTFIESKTLCSACTKGAVRSLIVLLGLVACLANGLQAQVVTANLLITPPYSVFYRDYAGYGKTNNMLLSLFSTTSRRVYLAGSVTKDDNSIVISLKNAYRPIAPIILNANTALMLNGLQLRKIYGDGTTSDLNLTGLTANDIALNQALPEGSYTFCIQVKDFDTREVLTTACKTIYVAYYDPPQILNPYNGSSVSAFNPQMLMVTWQNTAPQIFGVTYRLKIVKLIRGVTPLDAINNNVQLILDKGNLFTTNYPVDVASGVRLEPGALYCMQVSAQSATAYFKNNGKSEVTTFYYNGIPGGSQTKPTINFLNPVAYKGADTIEVSDDKPFVLSWHLFEANQTITNGGTIILSDSINRKYRLAKFKLSILGTRDPSAKKPSDKNFLYETQLTADGNGIVHNNILYDEEVADKAGFRDGYWYTAAVTAYDRDNNVIASNSSVDFEYRKAKDDVKYLNTAVHAVIRYGFKGFPELYNASGTPVEVEVLQRTTGSSPRPVIKVGAYTYESLAKASANTQKDGAVQINVSIPESLITGDSLYYRIVMDGAYYIDKDFSWISRKAPIKDVHHDTAYVSFGQLVAGTYGYSLRVNVSKEYTSYRINSKNGIMDIKQTENPDKGADYQATDSGMVYKVGMKKPAAGITVVLYRKTKKIYVPPVEGNLPAGGDPQYGDVEVARGVTRIGSDGKGHDTSYVIFDRLLSNIFNGDEYYVIALGGKKTEPPGFIAFSPSGGHSSYSYLNRYAKMAYKDSGYIAAESVFKLQKPVNIDNEDSLYRNVAFNYEITSTKPPTSIIKGRLLYRWLSDNTQQVRPLAKSSFKIVVDYLVNGKSIGYSTKFKDKTYEEKFFVPEGSSTYADGMQLLDFGKTMGTGTTDDQGNFEIEAINLNLKGPLGKGHVEKRGWTVPPGKQLENVVKGPADVITKSLATVFDPGVSNNGLYDKGLPGGVAAIQQSLLQSNNEQGFLNQGMVVSADNTGSFLVNAVPKTAVPSATFQKGAIQAGHGPDNEGNKITELASDEPTVDFQRVYRIVPDNPYIYPTMDTAVVQAFQTTSGNTFHSLVKEVNLQVFTRNDSGSLDEMKVIIFRSVADKTPDLPLGEGDGHYVQKALVNPQLHGNASDVQNAANLGKNDLFSMKFEYLWPAAPVNANGAVGFSTLLAGYGNYFIEAFSGPEIGLDKYYKATFQSLSTNIDDNDPALWDGTASPAPVQVTVTLERMESRALIRLVDQATQSSIPYGAVRVYNPIAFGISSATVPTDQDGYAEIKVSEFPLNMYFPGAQATIKFSGEANGYKPSPTAAFTFNRTGKQFVQTFSLAPAAFITGHIVSADENGPGFFRIVAGKITQAIHLPRKNVEAYIRTASGKVFSTSPDGYFAIPAAAVAGTRFDILPKDVAYFDTSYTMDVTAAAKKMVNLGEVPVFRRKHRIHFIINDAETGRPIQNAQVILGEKTVTTQQGVADFNFENVSVNHYTFIVRGPDAGNYIPITKNIANEESRDPVTVGISLERGSEISGKVLLDGSPVRNARVYIDADTKQQPTSAGLTPQGSSTNDANLLQARTDASGNFVLHGVPVNNQTIDLVATLDTNFAVSGDRQKTLLENKQGTANFSLTGYRDMIINNLHGFPMTVEKITPLPGGNQLKVTGLLHWTESVSNFSLNEVNQVLRVEDVAFKVLSTTTGKVCMAEEDNVILQGTTGMQLKYLDKYNVLLSAPINSIEDALIPKPLVVSKDNDRGVIKGVVQIVDNSFNYPSSYLNFSGDNFFFAEKPNGTVSNVLSALKSAVTLSEASTGNYRTLAAFEEKTAQVKAAYSVANADGPPDYFLSNSSGGNLQFSFIGFTAQADARNSYIDKLGKIHLTVTMNCNIKNATPEHIAVKLNDLVLDDNRVYPASSNTAIEVALENWTLSIKNWSISPEQGGIVSHEGLIRTAKLDIPFSTFVLRSDMFDIDNFKVDGLQLGGGIVTLTDIKSAGAGLVFDNKTGSDLSPHWRFTLSGTGGPVATIRKLPGLSGAIGINYVIGINYIQVLSNNESVFQLQQSNTALQVNNNTMAKFSPQTIANGPDYFNITGALNLSAPRLGDMSLELHYFGQNNALAMNLGNISADFEGKGFVHFTAVDASNDRSNISINATQVTISGQVEEKPAKSFNPVPALFTATNGPSPGFKVDLQKGFVMQLTSESNETSAGGYRLTIALGGMQVAGGDWSTLSYEGVMASNSASNKGIKDTYTKFNVLGDVSVSADKVEMENTTPFGKLTLIFDFPAKRLMGKLELDNVQMGTNTISGEVETLFDPDGFYVAGGGSAEIHIGNPIADGTYDLGFMIGSYPLRSASDELWKVVTAYKQPEVKNDCFVKKLDGRLAGFYMSVDRMIFDVDYDFDFVIVSGYVNGKALVGVDMWANFSGQTSLGVAVKVYAHAGAGMSAITGTSISGSITALAALKLAYEQNKFVVQGSIDMSFEVSIHQSLIATSVSASTSVGCRAQGGTEGFSFELTQGQPVVACY